MDKTKSTGNPALSLSFSLFLHSLFTWTFICSASNRMRKAPSNANNVLIISHLNWLMCIDLCQIRSVFLRCFTFFYQIDPVHLSQYTCSRSNWMCSLTVSNLTDKKWLWRIKTCWVCCFFLLVPFLCGIIASVFSMSVDTKG